MVKVMNARHRPGVSQAGADTQIAGKTGTAQVFTVGAEPEYNQKRAQRAPARPRLVHRVRAGGAPKLAVAVIIENGKHGTAAAPIARRVLDQFLLGHTTTPEIPPPVKAPDGTAAPPEAAGDE